MSNKSALIFYTSFVLFFFTFNQRILADCGTDGSRIGVTNTTNWSSVNGLTSCNSQLTTNNGNYTGDVYLSLKGGIELTVDINMTINGNLDLTITNASSTTFTIGAGKTLTILGNLGNPENQKTTYQVLGGGVLIVTGTIYGKNNNLLGGSGTISAGSVDTHGDLNCAPGGCPILNISDCSQGGSVCTNNNTGSTCSPSAGGSITGSQSACTVSFDPTVLTATGYTGTILRWEMSVDGGTSWTGVANTSATYDPPVTTVNTQYRVTVIKTSPSICFSSSTPATLIVGAGVPATPGTITQPTNKCANSTGNIFNISPVTGATSYNWSVTGTGWAVTAGGNSTSATITIGTGNGTVSVTASNSCGTSTPRSSGTITPTNNPVSVSISANPGNVICSGSAVTFTATPTNGGTTPTYQWKINSINSGTNNAIFSTSSLLNNDVVSVELSSNASCASNTPATSNQIAVTVNSDGNWIGTTNNWNTATNWCGGVPTSTQSVTINSGTPTDPVISATANANSITINSGASLTISGTNTLNVYGNWANNGTFTPNDGTVRFTGSSAQSISGNNTFKHLEINNTNGVSITSGAGNTQTVEGIITLNGILTTNNNLTLDLTNNGMIQGPGSESGSDGIVGNVTVKRTMPANSPPSWHYVSTPLGNETTIAEYNDNLNYNYNGIGTYYWYDEKVRNAEKNIGFKPYYGPSGLLGGPTMRGVAIYQTTPLLTLDITGPYNHYATYDNLQLSLTPYTTGTRVDSITAAADGWHLIGNPYPSALDWNAIYPAHTNNVSGTVYVYNNSLGRYGYYNAGTGVYMDGPIIPAMQAFFVQAINHSALAADRNISINYASRSTGSQAFYRRANFPSVRINLSNNELLYDETVIRFADEATDLFDAVYDAIKFEVDAPHPHLSSKLASREYAINTLEGITLSTKEIPLVSRIYQDGTYTFTCTELESIDASYAIYLEDLKTGEIYNLRSNPTVSFSALKTDNENRFILKFQSETITATNHNPANAQIKFINTGSKNVGIEFAQLQNKQVDLLATDLMGREIYNIKGYAATSGTANITFKNTGVYILKVKFDNQIATETIVVTEK